MKFHQSHSLTHTCKEKKRKRNLKNPIINNLHRIGKLWYSPNINIFIPKMMSLSDKTKNPTQPLLITFNEVILLSAWNLEMPFETPKETEIFRNLMKRICEKKIQSKTKTSNKTNSKNFKKRFDDMNIIKCAIKPATVDSFLMNIATKSISREKKLIWHLAPCAPEEGRGTVFFHQVSHLWIKLHQRVFFLWTKLIQFKQSKNVKHVYTIVYLSNCCICLE